MKIDWSRPWNWAGAAFAVLAALIVMNRVGEFFGLSKADWAAWVQAVGSIAAIIVAIQVTRVQALDARKLIDETRDVDSFNALLAMSVEITTYAKVMEIIKQRFDEGNAVNRLTIFPPTAPDFPVYVACASALGSHIANKFRGEIIATYGNIRTTFEALNRCSELARQFDKSQHAGSDIENELDILHKRIPEKADVVVKADLRIQNALGIINQPLFSAEKSRA